MDEYLSSIYYDESNPAGFGTLEKLYTACRLSGKPYKKGDIEEWLQANDTYTLHKPQRKNFPTRKTMAYNIDQCHQADLADMSRHAKANGNIKFLLIVVDVLSKYGWAVPLKNKSNDSMLAAFKMLYQGKGSRTPSTLGTDAGKEFTGNRVQAFFKTNGIHHYTLKNRQKAAVAERLIRTLKETLYKYMDSNGSEEYVSALPNVVRRYNSSTHSSIKMKPVDVNPSDVPVIFHRLYGKRPVKMKPPKFVVGDTVRISAYKHIFSKGFEQNWTDELFTITRALSTQPRTYKLNDYYGEPIQGSFYEQEMIKVVIGPNKEYRIDYIVEEKGRGKTKQYLVKYKGFSRPEWTTAIPTLLKISSSNKRKLRSTGR